MVSPIVTVGALIVMMVILASILFTVKDQERYAFISGILLIVVGTSFGAETAGTLLALLGAIVVFASAVPLLRQQPTTS